MEGKDEPQEAGQHRCLAVPVSGDLRVRGVHVLPLAYTVYLSF